MKRSNVVRAVFSVCALSVSFLACASAPEPVTDEAVSSEEQPLSAAPPPGGGGGGGIIDCHISKSCSTTASSWFASSNPDTDAFEAKLKNGHGCSTPRIYTGTAKDSCSGLTGKCWERYSVCTASAGLTTLVGQYATKMPHAHFNANAHDACLAWPAAGKVYVFWESMCSSPNCGSGCKPPSW